MSEAPLFARRTTGIAASADALPLFGLEFKLVSLLVILGALAWITSRGGASSSSGVDATGLATARRTA